MTSVEKRRSSRKSSRHRKHSDGGFSDTSSGGSFLDENDREVCNLTDRAFRSLCIGDEAVYNDSDLSLSSPNIQRDRQLAFSQSGHGIGTEAREVEDLKRAAHENFSLRMQQYGQDWNHGGMYGEIHRDPQWGGYGQRTQGRVSATFQHSFVETSQQGNCLSEEELSSISNGGSQQRRSRSRVSSLIRAFNSEGQRDGAGINDKFREWNDEQSWDKSALMSIQRELSEFSTSYQQNFDNSYFPSSGPFSSRDANVYSSEVAAMAHMSHNSVSSFMRASHSNHSMSAQVNCNSNFFIHSEFSPFKVWRDHNRFPFQQGEVTGFMHASEFPKWYETPMYKELTLENPPQVPYRSMRYQRNNLASVAPPVPPYSSSTYSVLQKASAVEKRCESELASHYPYRRRSQSLGTNRLPSQRPSTASPTIEMSRRVRDTISSVKALQQKIDIMTEQNITTGVIGDQQGVLYGNDNFIHPRNSAATLQPNIVSSNTSATPFNINQMVRHSVHAYQEADMSGFQQHEASPQPVEHPPVRAESRGATPEIRMSTYKSRATSLLFNLKDNRKRVKSTYSPPKFKGLDTPQKNKQSSLQEPRDTVIDVPEDSDMQSHQVEEFVRTNASVNQYHSPGQSLTTQSARENTEQYPENSSSDYQTAQMQGQMVRHPGFSGFIAENYTSNQLTNGQNPHEHLASFTPYGQGGVDNIGTLEGLKQSYTVMDTTRLNTDNSQNREYLMSKTNTEQAYSETTGRVLTNVDRYEQLKGNEYDYNVTSTDEWRQTNNQNTEKISLKATSSPLKQETALQSSRQENTKSRNEKVEMTESFGFLSSSRKNDLIASNSSKQLQEQQEHRENKRKDGHLTQNYNRYSDQEHSSQHKLDPDKIMATQKTGQMRTYTPLQKGEGIQRVHQTEAKPQFENNNQKKSSFDTNNAPDSAKTNLVKDKQFVDVMGEQVMVEHRTEKHTHEKLAKAEQRPQVEQPKAESARVILAEQTGSEKVKAEESKSEPTKPERVNQVEEHIKEEKRKREKAEQYRGQQSEVTRGEHSESKQIGVQKLTNEPKTITEKSSNRHKGEQGVQVKGEQAEKEKLKEEQTKTELTNIEQTWPAKIKQAKTEKTTEKNIPMEHVEEEQLSSEQAKREHRTEAEQIRKEKLNPKLTGTEVIKAQTEQAKEPQSKAKHTNTKEVKGEEVKTDQSRVEDVRQAKDEMGSIHVDHVNAEKPPRHLFTANGTKLKEKKPEHIKLEENKLKLTKIGLSKTENLLEKSAELTSKLAATPHARSEPDKVEKVKTELAKAKAELAKIKEKMRGEQKEKLSNFVVKQDVTSKNNVPLNMTKDEDKKQNKAVQMQADRGAEDYDNLRGKYGFINEKSAIKSKVSTTGSVASKDANETKVLSLGKNGTVNNEKSKDGHSPTSTFMASTDNKAELRFKQSEVTANQFVDSESKKLKLSCANSFPPNENNKENEVGVTENLKNNSVENLEKCDSGKDAISQKDSDLAKMRPLERKSKTDNSVGPGKDLHVTPLRALSQKEKAQTKQEILTSKIKAHAEKEISAIKEKGFALGKTSTKQLASSHIRQRPPSQEASKKQESTVSSNISAKHQSDSSERQTEPTKLVLPLRSATTTQTVDHLEKPRQTNQTANSVTSITEGLVQKQTGFKSPVSNEEQAPKTDQGKKQVNHGEISKKQKEELHDNKSINREILNKRKEDPTQAAPLKAANPSTLSTKKAESKEAACDKAAPVNISFGQTEAADDSVHIMGIMVTVRERKSPVNTGQENDRTEHQMKETEIEPNITDLDKKHSSSGKEENTPSKEISLVKANDEQKTLSTLKENHTKVVNDKGSEIAKEATTLEARKNNIMGSFTEKKTNLQQGSSSTIAKPQWKTQPEQVEKSIPYTDTVSAKDKVLAETRPILYQHPMKIEETREKTDKTPKENLQNSMGHMMTDEAKNKQQMPTTGTNEGLIFKTADNGSNSNNAETVSHNLTVKEDMTVINDFKRSNIDGQSAPSMEENSHDSVSSNTFTKAKSVNGSAENESRPVSQKLQHNDTHIGEKIQVNDNVHIENIAIRAVPAVTEKDIVKNDMKIEGKTQISTFSSDVELASKNQHTESSSSEEQVNNLTSEHCFKDFKPTDSEQKTKSLEDKLAVQHVLSSVKKLSDSIKMNNKQSNTIEGSENAKAENGKQESNTQPVEGGYFQVQGLTETSKDSHNNCATVGDTSKGREHSGLQPNETTIRNESQKGGKSESFVFNVDQGKRKADELSSGSICDKNMNRKKLETGEAQTPKQTYGSMDRLSNNEKQDQAHQANHIRKHHRENSPSTSPNTGLDFKSKPKERVTTVPEISAIADYARLKVIVSEDNELDKVPESPLNKKEGFFPLIQTRHSRRPVFTVDPQDLSVTEKSLSNKTDMNAKVSKEPKSLVFPIVEKEHQRTGMFKLGDKDTQEKMHLDSKMSISTVDNIVNYANYKEAETSATVQTECMAGAGARGVDQSTGHPNNHPSQSTNSSYEANRPNNNISEECTYLDRSFPPRHDLGQIDHRKENRKDDRSEKQPDKDTGPKGEDGGTDQFKGFATQHEETETGQRDRRKGMLEERVLRNEKEKREEDMRIKHKIEALADEKRRATEREEEKRAREHEAAAIMIKERREKQRKVESRAEEERRAKEKEEDRVGLMKEQIKTRLKGEEIKTLETGEKRTTKIEEERVAKLTEQQNRKNRNEDRRSVEDERASQKEQHRKGVEDVLQRRPAEEEHHKRAVEEQQRRAEEQRRKAAQVEQQRQGAVEQQRRALQEEQRRAAEEQQKRALQEEQRRQAEEQQRRALQEEQRRAAEEQQRRALKEEQQRKAAEEQQRRALQEEQERRAAGEQQRRALKEEQQRKAAEEKQKKALQEEQERRAAEEQKRRALQEEQQRRKAAEEQQRRALQEEQERKAAEEQQRRASQEEQQRKAAEEKQRRAAQEEQQMRAAAEEQQKKALQEEQERRAAEEQKRRALQEEQQRRKAAEEQQRRALQEEQERKAAEEQQRRAAQEEQQRKAAEEKQRRAAQEEQQRKAAEEQQRRAAQEEQQRKAAEEQQRRAAQEEQQRKAAEEQQRRASQEEQQRKSAEEKQRRAAQEEQQRKAAEEQQRRAAQEEQQRKAAEEKQRRAAQEEQQRKAAEEKQRRAAQEEQQRKVAEEKQRRAAQEEQQRKAAEEKQRRAAQEEQQRKAAEEKQRRAAQEEQQRKAAEEQQRRAAQEEQQRKAAEEKQRRAAQEEQQRKAAEEQQRRAAQEEQQRKAAEEKQRRAAQEEQQRRAAEKQQKKALQEEQQRRAAEEQKRRALQEEQQRRKSAEEQQRRAAQDEQQMSAAVIEEQRQAKTMKETILEENNRKEREVKAAHIPEKRIVPIQEQNNMQRQSEEQKREKEEWTRAQKEKQGELTRAAEIRKEKEEKKAKTESPRHLEDKRVVEVLMPTESPGLFQAKTKEEAYQLAAEREKARAVQTEKQRRATQKTEALQYYAITSTDTERTPTERQQSSPAPSQQRNNPLGLESPDEYHSKHYRPHAPASPAPSLPRSNTSSPAPGAKPSMFRVKDNTIRGSLFTKSVKPRFHKSFGELSPMDKGSDRGEDEQEGMRRSAGTPVLPDMGLNRLSAINDSSNISSTSLPKDYSIPISHHRPYSRRSIVMDDDESRSVISNLSEDVESFATSAADLADLRGLLDCERPDSACSFSSDVSRSLGKPPAVPPKSEKALRRAQRLTSRRMKKELSKSAAGTPAGAEKEVSSIPSSSTEVCTTDSQAVASPHFSAPVSLAHAPALGSSLPSSYSEHRSVQNSFHASPHATGPISLPFSSPHATTTLPAVSSPASVPASQSAAPKTIAHVPSSPTLYHANHATPVAQYHVESSRYSQSFPMTQRKVLQDLGSGQYFVVDVPVQVKTKTFFDPETGKYVQLNVRESGKSISQTQPQQTCPQPQLQPQTQIKTQQQPLPQASIAGKPLVFYHGFQSYPQSYAPSAINSIHPNRSSASGTLHHDQQPPRESHSYRNSATEGEQTSQGHCYSPEKTPYMDTVNDAEKTYNPENSTQNSYETSSQCETDSQLAGTPVCENDNLANSLCGPRDIITMSELEDFMEVSDW